MNTNTDFHAAAEQNKRSKARSDYRRWLRKRYGSSDMREMIDAETPISLQQLYIPVRLSTENKTDESMANPASVASEETKDNMDGEDAWQLIARERFVVVSGKPGSGKTTLVKSIINELCNTYPSQLRRDLMGDKGIAPIPLILREMDGLEHIHSFEALMAAWWKKAKQQNNNLDIHRLQQSFDLHQENFPCIYMFDGLDEVGGEKIRQNLINMAMKAAQQGHRILLTGRPSGFEDLNLLKHKTHYLTPLPWPLIEGFINDWYKLRTEWQHAKQRGIPNFLNALQESKRAYLLTLARRPIFLTLMALIHCERNEMPHARAELYEAIVDIYLNRQAKHRQLKFTTKGEDMPHWSSQELRMLLSYVAWESQKRAAYINEWEGKTDTRRIIWQRQELEDLIKSHLEQGRFSDIQASDSQAVIDFFLNPAGLLVEPEVNQIQFAHLSFQEYLCAEHVLSKLSSRRFEADLKKHLFNQLPHAGWDEVAILLLTIHARKMQNEGHFEILAMLDISVEHQARLLVQAICGQELPIEEKDRVQWLPVMMGAILLHPHEKFGALLRPWPELEAHGLPLLKDILKENNARKQWITLTSSLRQQLPKGWSHEDIDNHSMFKSGIDQWLKPNFKKEKPFYTNNFYYSTCLSLLANSSWGYNNKSNNQDTQLQIILLNLIEKMNLWKYEISKEISFPIQSINSIYLTNISKNNSQLWTLVKRKIPLSLFLLTGEPLSFQQELIKFSQCLPPHIKVALHLHRIQTIIGFIQHEKILYQEKKNNSLICYRLSKIQFQYTPTFKFYMPSFFDAYRNHANVYVELNHYCSKILQKNKLTLIHLSQKGLFNDNQENLFKSEILGLSHKTRMFQCLKRESEDPQLMLSRGLIPHEPAPKHLNFFDKKGLPHNIQKRENWVNMRAYLNNFDAILKFVLPNGIPKDEQKILIHELKIVQKQPWSPHVAIDTMLEAWPKDEPERDCSLETAENHCVQACETLLAEVESEKKEQHDPT